MLERLQLTRLSSTHWQNLKRIKKKTGRKQLKSIMTKRKARKMTKEVMWILLKNKSFIRNRSVIDYASWVNWTNFQRIVDSITPEALFLTLYYGTGVLLIRSDEFKGFYDKFIIGAQNMSSFCSAYSGEPFNYTTVARGSLIYFLVDANIVALLRSPGHCRQQTDNSWIDSAWTVG